MSLRLTSLTRVALLSGVVLLIAACSDLLGNSSSRSPLEGLSHIGGEDSLGNSPPPPPPGPMGPGYVHGTVLGPWEGSGSAEDSLANAPRVAGVVVEAFRLPSSGVVSPGNLGAVIASAVTDASGKFTLPSVDGGNYAVTFTPPGGGIYGGVWVTASIHADSHDFPWWIVLWKR